MSTEEKELIDCLKQEVEYHSDVIRNLRSIKTELVSAYQHEAVNYSFKRRQACLSEIIGMNKQNGQSK